jgi:hypothetical protein
MALCVMCGNETPLYVNEQPKCLNRVDKPGTPIQSDVVEVSLSRANTEGEENNQGTVQAFLTGSNKC